MYYKINHSGCSERKGLCEIRYDLYLDPEDHNYSEHHVQVKVSDDPEVFAWQNNPFCCHFVRHKPDVTDEEILKEGDKVLQKAYKNWQKGNLHLTKNEPVEFAPHKETAESRIRSILSTDFESLKVKVR
jgi:hypothetical protein